jgi:hypothetical protein
VILVLKEDSLSKKEREKLSVSYFDVGKEPEPYVFFVFAINAEHFDR